MNLFYLDIDNFSSYNGEFKVCCTYYLITLLRHCCHEIVTLGRSKSNA